MITLRLSNGFGPHQHFEHKTFGRMKEDIKFEKNGTERENEWMNSKKIVGMRKLFYNFMFSNKLSLCRGVFLSQVILK